MKRLINIPDYKLDEVQNGSIACGEILKAVKNGTSITKLELDAIANAVNYLLGAELLEENGYTEEIINALKSVLSKCGSEV